MTSQLAPFTEFVIKLHSRCDLACDHCYIFEHEDTGWMGRPLGMSQRTLSRTAERIAEHAAAHRVAEVHLVLHGGEPLLVGAPRMKEILAELTSIIPTELTRLDLRIHTNGVLLDRNYCELFREYDVKVGISLDGDRAANDRHRLYRDGRSSYDKVVQALKLLRSPEYRHLYAGLLCTVDITNDPDDVYRGLLEHEPPRIDLLLPHATWEHQPPGLDAPRDLKAPTLTGRFGDEGEYAHWFKRVFDVWNGDGRPVPVRIFDSVIGALHGRPSQTESLGLGPVDLLVVEVDGTLEQADSLRTAYNGAAATGFNVFRDDFDRVAAHPGFANRQHGLEDLCDTCQACPVVAVCGGGLYAHRYSSANGFNNPSIYCADLMDIITHIDDAAGLPTAQASVLGHATDPAQAGTQHNLTPDELDALGAGYGGTETIRRLVDAQHSIRRELFAVIGKLGPQQDRRFVRSWDLIAELDATHPAAVAHVLTHPYTRTWAIQCLTALHTDSASRHELQSLELLAASAALRAGVAATLPLPVFDGAVPLPTLGALTVPHSATDATIEIHDDGVAVIHVGSRSHHLHPAADDEAGLDPDPAWQGLRRLRAGALSVVIEDTDPYRMCHGQPAERLTLSESNLWGDRFRDALEFVDKHLPLYAPGLRTGLTTLMPMARSTDGTHRSAAARHAFGAIGAALPEEQDILALLLVHEYQHIKLGAILDLYDLYDVTDTAERHYAPWRPDPRPIEGLLQGTYAHVAVTEFWRAARAIAPVSGAAAAETQFARWRGHTAEAVTELLRSGSLTPLGERYVHAMGETVAPWLDEPVSAGAARSARQSSVEHRAAYERALRAAT